MLVFYGMAILWVHGIGFEIRAAIWKVIFTTSRLPYCYSGIMDFTC